MNASAVIMWLYEVWRYSPTKRLLNLLWGRMETPRAGAERAARDGQLDVISRLMPREACQA